MENTRGRLNGKTALVTGAARRIGREISLSLANAGANIVMHYRHSAGDAGILRDDVVARGAKAWLVEGDFDDPDAPQRLFSRAVEIAGPIDILVNNASLFLPSTLADIDFAGLMRHVQVNAWAPFVLSREFARNTGQGKIINLLDSRVSGHDAAHVAYILSKGVFSSMTRMMAAEFAPGITVNGVAPGLILPPSGKGSAYLDELARHIPLKRHGSPADIVDAVLYLLGSDFVTGQIIFVDGGRHLMEQSDGPYYNH